MAREACPNAQLFNGKVGVYFRGSLFPIVGATSNELQKQSDSKK